MALIIIVGLLILVLAAVPVAAVLGILSFVLDHISMGGSLTPALAEIYWDKSKEFILVAVPMFILLGEIMLRAGIAQRMYGAVIQWISWLPGGLMHANIGSCTIFAASSGSSVAKIDLKPTITNKNAAPPYTRAVLALISDLSLKFIGLPQMVNYLKNIMLKKSKILKMKIMQCCFLHTTAIILIILVQISTV